MRFLYFLKFAIICGIIIASINVNAQMVGTNVFIQGKYVEAGITSTGAFGASSPPAGYHPDPPGALGFVADPAMDGWTVGSPPYIGDYFYPGSPFEGWELQVNGVRSQAFCCGGFTGVGSGSNISYTTSGSTKSGTWQGMIDSIIVTQVTTLDTLGLYFTMNVTLTNIAHTPQNNIYYLRSLDPDNAEAEGGPFSTNNFIEHQVPDTTVVSAITPGFPFSYLALGTADTPAVAFIYNSWSLSLAVDLGTVFNKTYTPAQYTQGVPDDGDIAIGLVIKIAHLTSVDSATDSVARETAAAHLHPANSASFSFFYAFSPAAADSAIKVGNAITIPIIDTTSSLGIKNVNVFQEVKVYPNPSKNIINIKGLNTGDQVALYDMMGRRSDQNWAVNGTDVNTYSVNNIPAGAYILVVNDISGNMKARVPIRKL